jgi:uncharacterized cupredoxin-like copper-binding protein
MTEGVDHMRLRYGLVALTVGLLGLSLVLAACGGGGGGGGNSVALSEYKFDPPSVTVKANQQVTINLRNTGTLVHDWVVQGLPQPVQAEVQPGRSGSVTFTPTQAGTFRVICTQPAHEASGMVGQLIVEP